MRSEKLSQSFDGKIIAAFESKLILYWIGQSYAHEITKLNHRKKTSTEMKYRDYIKLGILIIQRELGKNKYSKRAIKRAFAIGSNYDTTSNKSYITCNFIINKSHNIFKKAYELKGDIEHEIDTALAKTLHTECSKRIAPYQINTCYTYYNSDILRNQQLKEYLKVILKEVDNFEAK